MNRFILFLRNIFSKNKVEDELQDELGFHLEMQTKENKERGMEEREAWRQAALQLGGLEQTKESVRYVRNGYFLETLLQDLRYAIRSLLRQPGFLAIALLILTVGIGANTAIFSIAEAVLFRPLPYPNPQQLVTIWQREKDGSLSNTNYATFGDWKERLHSFRSIAVMSYWQPTLSGDGKEAVPLEGMSVSRDFFKLLGVQPMLGRDFLAMEDRPQANRVVILNRQLWKQRFHSDISIIGKQILLNGIPRTVVGVMPPEFQPLIAYNYKETQVWRPLGYDQTLPEACRDCNHLQAIARMRAGVTMEQAASETDSFTRELIQKYPNSYGTAGATLVPLQEQFVSRVKTMLLILLVGVGMILLIGCSNLANLILSRSIDRRREMTIRAAMGAGRRRLVRQLLTESLLLALAGGLCGILFAHWAADLLVLHAPIEVPRLQNASLINEGVLAYTFLITLFCGVLFGLIPALNSSDVRLGEVTVESVQIAGGQQTFRAILVAINISLALVLVAGTGLMLQSVRHLLLQKLGFEPDRLVTMTVSVGGLKYQEDAKVHQFYRQLLERVSGLSGVKSASVVSQLPLSTNLDNYGILVKDKPVAYEGLAPSAQRFAISSNYFQTMKIQLLRGRAFTSADTERSQPVVIVNRTFASRIWPGEDPIGKQIHIAEKTLPWRTVVGVVEDVRHITLADPFALQFYMPFEQWSDNQFSLVIQAEGKPSTVVTETRRVISSIDPNQPVFEIATMNQVIEANIGRHTFALRLLQLFAVTALVLAALGVYGVMAYNAGRRFHEIGIRMALGAKPRDIITLLLRSGVRVAILGIGFGFAAALLLMKFLRALLFEVRSSDPAILISASLILFAVACIACFVPAFRAARSNPLLALRHT